MLKIKDRQRMEQEQESGHVSKNNRGTSLQEGRTHDEEQILAALALLFGPETEYHVRVRATRRLIRLGSTVLPLLLTALDSHPEITTPPWPWWPPQYEHFSRLLIHLSQRAQMSLEMLLRHPVVSQPPGPVLWTSVIEAANRLPDHESLLREGLTARWMTVRYAAAMALASMACKTSLLEPTLDMLRAHQCADEAIPVQLAASYALLQQGDSSGIAVLLRLLHCQVSEETRKAAAFVLAAAFQPQERHVHLSSSQAEQLTRVLISSLQDQNGEVAMHAACALGHIASTSALPSLWSLLDAQCPQVQIAALAVLEEMMSRKAIRRVIQHTALPARVVGLLHADVPEVRRQAGYTLAAFGGEYAAAVLGTTLFSHDHPGRIEAIEGLRLLHGVLRAPMRTHVVRWLLQALHQPEEVVKVTALDSLGYLAWQARTHRQKRGFRAISNEVWLDGVLPQLLTNASAWVRQRTVELLGLLESQLCLLQPQLTQLLHADHDSGVRACVAYTLGQTGARWAIAALLQALLDPDAHVAESALNALALLASPDDVIVMYVMKELALCDVRAEDDASRLAQSARVILKKWRRRSVG